MAIAEILSQVMRNAIAEAMNPGAPPDDISFLVNWDMATTDKSEMERLTPDRRESFVATVMNDWGDYYAPDDIRKTFDLFARCTATKYSKNRKNSAIVPGLFASINPGVSYNDASSYATFASHCAYIFGLAYWKFNVSADEELLMRPGVSVSHLIQNEGIDYLASTLIQKAMVDSEESARDLARWHRQIVGEALRQSGIKDVERIGRNDLSMHDSEFFEEDDEPSDKVALVQRKLAALSGEFSVRRILDQRYQRAPSVAANNTSMGWDSHESLSSFIYEYFDYLDQTQGKLEALAIQIAFFRKMGQLMGLGQFHHPLERIL